MSCIQQTNNNNDDESSRYPPWTTSSSSSILMDHPPPSLISSLKLSRPSWSWEDRACPGLSRQSWSWEDRACRGLRSPIHLGTLILRPGQGHLTLWKINSLSRVDSSSGNCSIAHHSPWSSPSICRGCQVDVKIENVEVCDLCLSRKIL